MLSRIYSPSKQEQGFTLIELLVVIIIIGILAAIAIPLFLDQRKLAVDASVKSDVRNTLANIQTWQAKDEANRTKAIANTGEFTNATNGGKVSQTTGNSIGVSIDSSGAATVCAYNAGGKTYTADTASGSTGAYVFNPATGQFSTGSCVASSTTGGTATAAGATSAAPANAIRYYDFEDGTVQGWVADSRSVVSVETVAGRKALKLTRNTVNYDYNRNAHSPWQTDLTVGKKYVLTAYMYLSSETDTSYLSLNNPGANTPTVSTKNAWTKTQVSFTANATGTGIEFYALPNVNNATAPTVYLDDVSIVPE